ncbi:MAG: hypothetical protein JW918_12785 [Anaerolineae bacterium]|nr:hypothetical protein [Anaerolineae bacterium]
MDHIKILKRAFKITWDYKVLWIFGIILALTMASGGGGGNGAGGSSTPPEQEGASVETPGTIELPDGREIEIPKTPEEFEAARSTLIAIGAGLLVMCGVCCCLSLACIVVRTVLRWVAETALIRMVDDYEETGEKRGVREGFKMGWSRASLRLFLIDLLFFLAGLAIVILVLILMAAPVGLAVWMFTQDAIVLGIISTVFAAGVFFMSIFLGIIVSWAVEFVKPFFYRACVLENLGVGESLQRGLDIVKRHFAWDVVIMWLLVVGLNIAWIIASLIVGFMLFFVALIMAAIPFAVVFGLVSLIFDWIVGLIVSGLVGGLILFVLLIVPWTFLQGLWMTFLSTLWTLTYRELLAIEGLSENGKEPWEEEHKEEEGSHELQ